MPSVNENLEKILEAIESGGGDLTPAQLAAINSILALSDTYVPIKDNATNSLVNSQMYQDSEGTLITPGAIQSGTNTFKLDLAWLLDSAGYGVRFKNIGAGQDYNVLLSEFNKSRHPSVLPVRNGNALGNNDDFQLPINLIDTDILTNPEYSVIVPPITDEDSQTATIAHVKIDPSSVLTSWNLEFSINGTIYTIVKEPLLTSGDYTFTYSPEIDIPVGATLNVKIYSDDGDVKMLGDSVSGIPYLIQEVQQLNYKSAYHLEDEIPRYVTGNSGGIEKIINNAETVAADTSNEVGGSMALTVDESSVNWFNIFDYAGNWNIFRQVTINFSGGDTYILRSRRRRYFFYKDENNAWQWYYTNYRAG